MDEYDLIEQRELDDIRHDEEKDELKAKIRALLNQISKLLDEY